MSESISYVLYRLDLPRDAVDALTQEAEQTGETVNDLICRILQEYLK
jgi:hypothetical protein